MLATLISLPRITDPRGNLTMAEPEGAIPFPIRRVYWIYDVPAGESRGGHAHKRCKQIIIAVSGSFDVTLSDAQGHRETYHLRHPYQGLLVETGVWRTLDDFSAGAVCLVLASEPYDESDYWYDYDLYLRECLR